MPDNNNASIQQTPALPSPLEVTDQSFRRMPSQRRRRLWMLAARAAAQKQHTSHEREVAPAPPPLPLGTNLAEHRSSSLLKPGSTVRTQDSGISSMDYVTSREANSPNSEEAGQAFSATAGSSRPRANTTSSLLLNDRSSSSSNREPRLCSEVDPRPLHLSLGPSILSPHSGTTFRTTEIVLPKGEVEHRLPSQDYVSSHLNATQRYTTLCHNYVPDWVRRNWSSAPRPLIPRQRSSVETTGGVDTSSDWASMEALNIQHSLYPHNWRLYSGRYGGRFSCPKASAFFESSLNEPSTVHLETAEEEDDDDDDVDDNENDDNNDEPGGGGCDENDNNCDRDVDRNPGESKTEPQLGGTVSDVNPGGGNPYERLSPPPPSSSQADLDNPGSSGRLSTGILLRRRRRPGYATAVGNTDTTTTTTLPPQHYPEPEDLPQFSRSRRTSCALLPPQRIHTEPAGFPAMCWCTRAAAGVAPPPLPFSPNPAEQRAYSNPADFVTSLRPLPGAFAYHPQHRPSSHTGTSGLSPLPHCRTCPFRFMPHSDCTLNLSYHHHHQPPLPQHFHHHCPGCCLDYESLPPPPTLANIPPYGQSLSHHPLPSAQYDLPQRHVRRRMLKRMASEPLPGPTWTTVSPVEEGSPLGSAAPPRKRATPKPLGPAPAPPAPSTAISIVQPPIPARRVSPPTHIYADTRILDYPAAAGSGERTTGGAEVFIRAPDSTDLACASTTKRPDVRVYRSLRAGTGLIRGRSADEAYSSQCRGVEPFGGDAGRGGGEGGALSHQPYRMAASDFQIAHPHGRVTAGWGDEEGQAALLTETDPTCFHGLNASQPLGGHCYRRPRLCPYIFEEAAADESGWKPYEVAVEAAPARFGPFYPAQQRIRPASCRPYIQSPCLASPQMDRSHPSEGVSQGPAPPLPTIRYPYTRAPWRGSRRGGGGSGRGYVRSASYSMHSLEDSPASDFGGPPTGPPPPLPLDHPPWQRFAPSSETWGRARSLQVDVSVSTSVPASPMGARNSSHLCPRPLWRLGSSESRSDTTQSARPSTGSRQRASTGPLHNEQFVPGHALRRQDLQWKRKSFKRSNGYDAADLERVAFFGSSADEEIEPLVQASAAASNPQDGDYIASRAPGNTCRRPTRNLSDLERGPPPPAQREEEEEEEQNLRPQPTSDDNTEDVVIEGRSDDVDVAGSGAATVDGNCEAAGGGGGGGSGGGGGAECGTAVGSPDSHRVIRVTEQNGNNSSRTPSRTSHPPSRQVLGELAALGFNNRNEYWEHSAFGRARICALCLASIASLCLLYSFSSSTWAYSGVVGNVTRRGLWIKCYQPNRTCHGILPFISPKDGWHGGAICILLAAICLGLLGIGLSIVGHSGSDLLKRLYYFHSGGEIFFLAGFTTFLSLGIYRSYAQSNLIGPAVAGAGAGEAEGGELRFGAADTVGWVAGVLYFFTAFCLLLDEFIHELAKMSTRWPCLGVLLRWGAAQIARLSRWRHVCALRWRRCCRRTGGAAGRQQQPHQQKRLPRGPTLGASVTATRASSFGLQETVYRPTTGQLLSKKRGRR